MARIAIATVCSVGVLIVLPFLKWLAGDPQGGGPRQSGTRSHIDSRLRKSTVALWISVLRRILAGFSALIVCSPITFGQQVAYAVSDLHVLVRQKRYSELERELSATQGRLSISDRAFFAGILANRRNQVADSIRLLEPLMRTLLQEPTDRAELALCSLADDYAKSFRYGDAADTYSLLSRLPGYKEDESGCHAELEAERWRLLRQAPAQTTTMNGPFSLDENRTPAGFLEVVVQAPNFSDHWILDTGANLSAVTRTVADQLGLKLSVDSSTAQGSNGIFVRVHTAVIPEIQLGGATIQNVAVLVFEDDDLTFSQIPYQIHGSIGFPVLESLGRITFHANGRLEVGEAPSTPETSRTKLYLEGFTILLDTGIAGEQHLLTLDTGSTGTYLSEQYYQQHRQDFRASDLRELELVGAGGSKVMPTYVLHNLSLRIGGTCVALKDLDVLTKPTGLPNEFSGNVGQSVVGLFRSYTLDFHTMTFSADPMTPGRDKSDCLADH
jgi:Aspartyl protease